MEHESDEETIRIVIADGDPLVRRTLREALRDEGMTVVAEATSASETVELTTFYRPDVVVIDEQLPDGGGLETTRRIHTTTPDVRVVLFSAAPEDTLGLRALRSGAAGYLSKDFEPGVLPRVLRGVAFGEAAISRRLAMALVEADRRSPRAGAGLRPVRSPLTDREWEVLDLLASGARTEEIAQTLVLSTETVRSHLKNLYRKLEVRSRQEATEAAQRLRELAV
jgi:DNA-binding NarL/FixJ family response regulator